MSDRNSNNEAGPSTNPLPPPLPPPFSPSHNVSAAAAHFGPAPSFSRTPKHHLAIVSLIETDIEDIATKPMGHAIEPARRTARWVWEMCVEGWLGFGVEELPDVLADVQHSFALELSKAKQLQLKHCGDHNLDPTPAQLKKVRDRRNVTEKYFKVLRMEIGILRGGIEPGSEGEGEGVGMGKERERDVEVEDEDEVENEVDDEDEWKSQLMGVVMDAGGIEGAAAMDSGARISGGVGMGMDVNMVTAVKRPPRFVPALDSGSGMSMHGNGSMNIGASFMCNNGGMGIGSAFMSGFAGDGSTGIGSAFGLDIGERLRRMSVEGSEGTVLGGDGGDVIDDDGGDWKVGETKRVKRSVSFGGVRVRFDPVKGRFMGPER